jgi:hypothetical protein
MTGARVFPFFYRGDDSRRMRLVVTPDNEVIIEEASGHDALGVERWVSVDLEALKGPGAGRPEAWPHEWVAMAVLAVVRGEP